MALEISDPVYSPKQNPALLQRLALRLIIDPRDYPLIKLIGMVSLTVVPFAGFLFWTQDLKWWLGVAYLVLVMGYFFAPVILMLHNTSHRPLFRARVSWLKHLIPWGIGPFFGQTPETYFAHHIGMHHVEGNLPEDLSSTMRYQRDSILDFLHYLGSFYLIGHPRLLGYFRSKKRMKLFRRTLLGELAFYLLVVALFYVNTRATFVVFVFPFLIARFGMMAGNWAQHAFIDANDPGNSYRNSITCINSSYNRRCFNDGYHIGHHLKPNRHWTEMPEDFLKNRERYALENSIVFQGIDYFGIWFFLMLKRYDWLARRFVQVSDRTISQEEVTTLLRERTKNFQISVTATPVGTKT